MVDIQAVNKIGVGSKIEASFESGVTPGDFIYISILEFYF